MPAASAENSCETAIATYGSPTGGEAPGGATSGEVRKVASRFHAVVGNPAEHCVVGRRPGVTVSNIRGLLATDAQSAVLILIKNVPYPGDCGLMLRHLNGEIATHTVGGRLFARDYREAASLGFVVEILYQFTELARRQTIERIKSNAGAAWLRDRNSLVIAITPGQHERADCGQQPRWSRNAQQPATRAAIPTPRHRHPRGLFFRSLNLAANIKRS